MQPERSTEEKTLMKVGRITLLTAFLLALPLAAYAGSDPCPGVGDVDSDGFCDDVDNCPGTCTATASTCANPSQTDTDGDGRGDVCDNCSVVANGPLAYAVGLAANSQCDKDSDGYGNACDGDLDGNGFVTPIDSPIYLANLMAFIPFPPGEADMDCNGFMTPLDSPYYLAQLMAFLPGPSGWSCKGGTPGACHPLP